MGRTVATGRAWGKVILLGEHAVVYGYPALAAALGRVLQVRFSAAPGVARAPADPLLARALDLTLPPGCHVGIRSEIPVGRGLGSSAALAVALVRARASWDGEDLSDGALFERALAIETLFHGRPSGVDQSVAAAGGILVFQRGIGSRPVPPRGPLPLVVMDSGAPGRTRDLVAAVAARRPTVDPLLARIGALVEQAQGCLGDLGALGALMDEDHGLLREMGVSTPRLDELVARARARGALGAKLAGAGGGGVAVALVREEEGPALAASLRDEGVPCFFACLPVWGQPQREPVEETEWT